MTYASGKNAWGISDRSGRRYRLREMKVEWTGAKVGPDEFETKHPQLFPPKAYPDPQALRNPRPEQALPEQRSIQYGFNPVGFRELPGLTPRSNLKALGQIGTVTVLTNENTDIVNLTGVSATASVGAVTIGVAETFDSTSVTLDSTAQTFDEG